MATYYVDGAVGNDANAGTSEGSGNAWATIDHAMNTVTTADKVYVKASADYTETVTIDTAGAQNTAITFEGYTSTPGDGGRATINGSASRTTGIGNSLPVGTRAYYVFKNFRVTNHTSNGVQVTVNHLTWKNCKFDTNAGSGYSGRSACFEACEFSDNSVHGADFSNTGIIAFVGCKFFRNSQHGVTSAVSCMFAFCEFFSNGSAGIQGGNNNDANGFVGVINCTFDGDSKDSTDGINTNISFHHTLVVVNNILYDCLTGVTANHGSHENHVSRNNLVNANTTNYTGFSTPTGEVTSAPAFTNEASQDYTLTGSSPALNAGYDAGGGKMDIGAHQADSVAAAGGGMSSIRSGGNL